MGIFTKNQTGALDAHTAELEKVMQAVNRETEKLAQCKTAMADAERTLSADLADEAVGGGGGVQKAQAQVTSHRAEGEQQVARLRAVRGRLWMVSASAATEAAGVQPETLAAEAERAAVKFSIEWRDGVAAFSALMARRRQVERLLFKPLRELPEAAPSDGLTVVDLMPVHSNLTNLLHRLSAAGGIDTQSVTVQGDELPLRTSFLDALQKLEAVERLRHSRARHEALQAEGR